MEKSISVKVIAAIIAALAVITGIVLVVRNITKKEDAYRSILIYELEGTATIEREEIGEIHAVEQLYLESGDQITVADDSSMRLKLDDDKYITVESNSVFTIEAVGTKADSKTKIDLTQGAITNEIQNPLSPDSTYEVTTPNAVMAVRGTVFRVEVYFDETGKIYTKLSTFEGKVSSRLIFPDGTLDEEVIVEEGNEVIIYSDTKQTEYLRGPEAIVFEEFPLQTLYTLKDLMENDVLIVGISKEELEELIWGKEGEETSEEESAEEESETEEETDLVEETEEEASGEEEESKEKNRSEDRNESGEEESQTSEIGGIPRSTEAVLQEETENSGEEENKTYTVRFMYQGQVFGTQTVQDGQQAMRPKLNPAAFGDWDFDFSTEIKGDTNIEWKP